VNLEHLRAFFWLRWRLIANQLRRGGLANAVILVLLGVLVAGLVLGLFAGGVLLGGLALGDVSPAIVLYVWLGLTVMFLIVWCAGLLTELQRSEVLSLTKFLHLPVSLAGAFLINYLASLLSVSLFLFLPPMVGLIVGLTLSRGPAMALMLPMLAAFLLAVTAVTYQFQGWLATLMANKRRRRTVIVVATAVFVLIAQLPNLINVIQPWKVSGEEELILAQTEERDGLNADLGAGRITTEEFTRRQEEILNRYEAERQARRQAQKEQFNSTLDLVCLVLPPGWLPLGARGLAAGDVGPALLATLGLGLLGAASLWRGYRTTLRLYTGQYTAGARSSHGPARPVGRPQPSAGGESLRPATRPRANPLERQLPWLSEPAAAVALAGYRSVLRAPEAKMALIGPVVMVIVFGSLLVTRTGEVPDPVRPFLPFAAVGSVLLGFIQLVGNQFGFERSGFRVYVLSPASRRDILLGKNLSVAPMALGMAYLAVVLLQVVAPMRWGLFLAVLPQVVTMYLIYSLLANWLSILAPTRLAAGSLKAREVNFAALLPHLAFLILYPTAVLPTLVPVVVELGLEQLGLPTVVPVGLILSLALCAGMVALYRAALTWQGDLLFAREQRILDRVVTKAE
jgi:hypothetical protein